MTEPDLLERLRIESDRFARVPVFDKFLLPSEVHARLANLFLEAADEIASHQLFGDPEQLHTLRRQRDLALKERDEARREICNSKKRGLTTHLDYARNRGWDCFKEKNHNA